MEKEPDSTDNEQVAGGGEQKAMPASFGAYNPELSQKNWERSRENERWDASPLGRAAIRLVSRGGLGAAAFAWGSWYAGRGVGMQGYTYDKALSKIVAEKKPLQLIAKFIDTTAGKPIEFIIKSLHTGTAEEAQAFAARSLNFRPSHTPLSYMTPDGKLHGRSLGHEAVTVTFDFFCASVADALGRDLANLADPHIKHEWKDDKGHIDYFKGLKSAAKSLFRYVTYNGGEDWAVSVPYVFYLRGQRNFIKGCLGNDFGKRFNYDSDRGLNGGSFKVDGTGKVIGNYNLEGMLDLQGRFTAYNVGTLMYRELYNHIDNKLHGIQSSLYGSPAKTEGKKKNEPHGILHEVGDLAKWTARSVVKGVVTMTPAVPFFSIFRAPQSKYKGLFINPDQSEAGKIAGNVGILGYVGGDGNCQALHANEQTRTDNYFRNNNPSVHFGQFLNAKWKTLSDVPNHPLNNPSKPFDPYGQSFGVVDGALNKIGKAQNWVRSRANNIDNNFFGNGIPAKRFMDNYVNAAFAYTPYMYAKAETARIWDSGKMDVAAERMIDGAADLNLKEFKAGAAEVWQTIFHPHTPFADKKREAIAEQRIHDDMSPSDSLTKDQIKLLHRDQYDQLPWKERVVQGRKPEPEEAEKSHAEKLTKHTSYTDDIEMQKALRELVPPTNSIH